MLAGTIVVSLLTSIFTLIPGDYQYYQNETEFVLETQILETILISDTFVISSTTPEELLRLCNCVTGLRSFGVTIPIGTNAEDLPSNTTPHVGGVILFLYENGVYHAALIIEITAEYMVVRETNFNECEETTGRKVYYDDSSIRGFYEPKG